MYAHVLYCLFPYLRFCRNSWRQRWLDTSVAKNWRAAENREHTERANIYLKKRSTEESEVLSLTELQNIVNKQGDKIAQLEARIQELETVVKVEEVIPVETLGNRQLSERNGISVTSNKTYSWRGICQFSYFYIYIINSSSSKTSLKYFFTWF